MANETFTLIVVPDQATAEVRRYHFKKKWLLQAAIASAIVFSVIAGAGVHYVFVAKDASENRSLRDENLALKAELRAIGEKVEHMGGTLDRVERFDQKLRAITLLSDPQRNLAMGPTETEPQNQVPSGENPFIRPKASETPKALSDKLDKLSAEAVRQEQSLQELQAYFQDQRFMLASVPSVWPTRGWVTSDFGVRLDPYTSERVMHAGMDIAGPHGKEVISPSDGTVVFSGLEGGYGNVLVIDHGYGIKTRYGHLATVKVKAGEKVKRGLVIALLGNTGRSTGPHLHYEVRVNGIAQNPRKFILDD
ncbi:MAG: M23 family metallopeptidase [Myxococcaceae bacterium]|nr:M23 family metallopeptidase [Myxococcaceae bacterium]